MPLPLQHSGRCLWKKDLLSLNFLKIGSILMPFITKIKIEMIRYIIFYLIRYHWFDVLLDHLSTKHNGVDVRGGHFLKEDVGAFDAPFFSITSTEASAMDPQQRILLEAAYKAFENGLSFMAVLQFTLVDTLAAGIPMEQVVGSKTSVYTGCFTRDYGAIAQKDPEILSRFAITGVESSMLANRISWFYDLTGPSANIDTACSSSLMALHLAAIGIHWKPDGVT